MADCITSSICRMVAWVFVRLTSMTAVASSRSSVGVIDVPITAIKGSTTASWKICSLVAK